MKKFLASVGNAQLLGRDADGNIRHIMDTKTLTESSLSFSTTMEEVRAGEGAKLYGRFSHDSSMTVTLTDAMFDLEYIKLQTGAAMVNNPTAFYEDPKPTYVPETHVLSFTKEVKPIGEACGLDKKVVWIKDKGCDPKVDWLAFQLADNANTLTLDSDLPGIEAGDLANLQAAAAKGDLCVKYFISSPETRGLKVSANFFPSECILLLTTKLFAGDANSKETGKPIGSITVKIPRFQLDGQFDLSMAMSSASTMNLQGTALAVEDGTCEGAGVYCEIVQVLTDSTFTDGLTDIAFDEDKNVKGDIPVVFGLYKDGHYAEIPNNAKVTDSEGNVLAEIVFDPELVDGALAQAGAQKVEVKIGDNVIAKDNMTVVE